MAKTRPNSTLKEATNLKSKKKNKKSASKKLLSGNLAMAMKNKPLKDNPFETIWSRKKFHVLGKKSKGEERRTGLARSRAMDKRKNTLLKEYEQSGKSSMFVDKRIGEQNESLGEFDKAILRSQRELKVKMTRKSKYNLSDDEEDDGEIYGSGPFSERDDFEEELPPDEDADEIKKTPLLKHVNGHDMDDQEQTGITDGVEYRHKSKKEVMEEIILKSKFFKAQKSKEKEENEELVEQLDKDFSSLVQSEALLSLTQPGKMSALKALVNMGSSKELPKKAEETATPRKEYSNQEKPDNYDKLVKEMALERRARPSDRTKTPEEIAQEERERLEQLEEKRQERMLAKNDSSDEDDDIDDDGVNTASAKKLRSISGDDLGDSFSVDERVGNTKGWLDDILERDAHKIDGDENDSSDDSGSNEGESGDGESEEDEEGSEDHDESGKPISLKDWEQSDDDKLSTDLDDDDVDDEEGDEEEEEASDTEGEEEKDRQVKGRGIKKSKNVMLSEMKIKKTDTSKVGKIKTNENLAQDPYDNALPFVIEAPNSLEELHSLLENRSDSEVVEAISRIRACNAIRLAAENRKKMQVFYGILLQYFAVEANKKPMKFKLLNLLVKPLMEMSTETPFFAAICARQRIHHTRSKFCEDMKNPEKSCWPSMKTLFLLRLWSMIFPCSDFRHVVMTRAILLMCEYLMRCPITSGRDVTIGSFLCSMVLSVTGQSKKFCPEAIVFLRTLLISASEAEPSLFQNSQFYYLSELKMLNPWLRLQSRVSEIQSVDFLKVMNMPEDSPFFNSDSFRANVLMSVIETLRGFVHIYEGYNSFAELFLPVSTLLRELLRQENIPAALHDSITVVAELIEKKAGDHHMLRIPLQMRKQKPVPIKLLTPKFEENFVKGRDYDPDRERAERKKLLRQIKREAKGAARELRKDNYFISEVKDKDRALYDEERKEKYGKARLFLQEQEHAFKSGQLGKGRKRRR